MSAKLVRLTLVLAALLSAATVALADPSAAEAEPAFAGQIVELTNGERLRAGLLPLAANPELMAAAQTHSEAMAESRFFDHVNPITGTEPGFRIRAAGYSWRTWAENIATGPSTPAGIVALWMNSSGHRANILNPSFAEIGVGFASATGGESYWTQVFGAR